MKTFLCFLLLVPSILFAQPTRFQNSPATISSLGGGVIANVDGSITIVTNGRVYTISTIGGSATNAIGTTNGKGTNTFLVTPTLSNSIFAGYTVIGGSITNNTWTNGVVIVTNSSGQLVSISGITGGFLGWSNNVPVYSFDAGLISNLNATAIATGTISPSRMGTNVLFSTGGLGTLATNWNNGVFTYTLTVPKYVTNYLDSFGNVLTPTGSSNSVLFPDTIGISNIVNQGWTLLQGPETNYSILGGAGYFIAVDANGKRSAAIPAGGGGGGSATNAIGNLNGFGTNTTLYGITTLGTNEASGVTYFYGDGTRRYTNSTTLYSEVFTNGAYSIYNGTNLSVLSNLIVTGWAEVDGAITNKTFGAGIVTSTSQGGLRSSSYLDPTLMGTNVQLVASSNIIITTNYATGVITYTISSTGGGGAGLPGTNTQIAYGSAGASNVIQQLTADNGTRFTNITGITLIQGGVMKMYGTNGQPGNIQFNDPSSNNVVFIGWTPTNANGGGSFIAITNPSLASNIGFTVDTNNNIFTGGDINQTNLNNSELISLVGSNANSFVELIGYNNSTNSSFDIVAQARPPYGGPTNYYIDLGFNNDGYTNPIGGPLDGFLFVQGTGTNGAAVVGGNMWIGTTTSNTSINFFVANYSGSNTVMQLTTNAATINYPLTVNSNVNISGLLSVTNNALLTNAGSSLRFTAVSVSITNANLLLTNNVQVITNVSAAGQGITLDPVNGVSINKGVNIGGLLAVTNNALLTNAGSAVFFTATTLGVTNSNVQLTNDVFSITNSSAASQGIRMDPINGVVINKTVNISGNSTVGGTLFTTNTVNVGTTLSVGGISWLSNSLSVTAGGGLITGIMTNINTTSWATNSYTTNTSIDATLPFSLVVVGGGVTISGIANGSVNRVQQFSLLISNASAASIPVALPANTRMLGLPGFSTYSTGNILCTNGKVLQIDFTLWPNSATNALVMPQAN